MDHMKSQAAGLGANALLMIGSRRAGNTVIVRAKALYVKPVAKE
jgi:predicted AAA+ superfamily ATPase